MVKWCLLQIANDEAATVHRASLWHAVSWRHSQTRAHRKTQISTLAVGLAQLQDGWVEILAEVDDRVLEEAIATWALTLAPCPMLLGLLRSSHAMVTHVLTTALFAHLKVRVAVKLSDVGSRDATLAM